MRSSSVVNPDALRGRYMHCLRVVHAATRAASEPAGRSCSSRAGAACRRPRVPSAPSPPAHPALPTADCWHPTHAGSAPPAALPPSVARNAETSVCGRLRMNPTVSDNSTFLREGSSTPRIVGSSVANIRGDASTSALVSALNKRGFPRIGVADQRDRRHRHRFPPLPVAGRGCGARFRSALSRGGCAGRIFRRSVSSWVSPGPRVPMPPPSCDISMPRPRQPRQHVLQLRQFHLQLTFAGPRMPRKNVEDQLRAVNHPRVDSFVRCCAAGKQ